MKIEVCIESIAEAQAADQYNLNRVEVCGALDIGGITPSYSLIEFCCKQISIEAHVMIRPRGGNFVYSEEELQQMISDISIAGQLGADGVVFGCLNENFQLDLNANSRLLAEANKFNMESTLHRAIDLCHDFEETERLLQNELDFTRVLTSGRASNVNQGMQTLDGFSESNSLNAQVMAGGGVSAENAKKLKEIKMNAIHFSIRKKVDFSDQMGTSYAVDHDKIKSILHEIQA